MKVLLYSRAFSPAVGGMERFAEELAGWLSSKNEDVCVVTETEAKDGDERRPYQVLRQPSTLRELKAFRTADVVHVNGLSIRALARSLSTGRRPIVTHQGHQAVCPTGLARPSSGACTPKLTRRPCARCPEGGAVGRLKLNVHRRGAARASRNVCVSQYLERRLALPRGLAIYNPVGSGACASESVTRSETGLVAFAGRLVGEKGLDLLLSALPTVPDAHLEIAGDGPLRARLERLATKLDLAGRVTFLGTLSLEGVADLYQRASIVCVPSIWDEPCGYAAAEALALGRAVVATPVGALPELLGDGRGFIAARATPEALGTTLGFALKEEGARVDAGVKARAFALSELTLSVIGPRYRSVYEGAAS